MNIEKLRKLDNEDLEKFLETATTKELKNYIRDSEMILDSRTQVLHAIPECPDHGDECVPHAIEWIKKRIEND